MIPTANAPLTLLWCCRFRKHHQSILVQCSVRIDKDAVIQDVVIEPNTNCSFEVILYPRHKEQHKTSNY